GQEPGEPLRSSPPRSTGPTNVDSKTCLLLLKGKGPLASLRCLVLRVAERGHGEAVPAKSAYQNLFVGAELASARVEASSAPTQGTGVLLGALLAVLARVQCVRHCGGI